MRNEDKHMERKGHKTNGVRVGLSKIKELSKSSVKTARTITRCLSKKKNRVQKENNKQ